jgi:hypothetical protein
MRYTLLNKTTNEEAEVDMSYEDLLEVLKDKNIQQVFQMHLAYRIGRVVVSEAWRERLKQMKKANRGSTIEIP